jgi:hypothetical protein
MSVLAQVRATESEKTDSYRLIVFNRAGTAVLLESGPSGYDLPLVHIPKLTRSAKEITTVLRDRWHILSVLLFSGLLEQNPVPVYFAALEAQGRTCRPPEKMDWFPVHHTISHLLKNNKQRVLKSSYLRLTDRMTGEDPEPFSRLGWLSHLQDWVTKVIRRRGMELKDFEQLNGCETFSLIRFETTQHPVWFKAVGKPNLHEFPITLTLAKLFPGYVPSIFDTQPACHGWLMADANGSPLSDARESSAWKNATTALASLQIESQDRTEDLLEAGCKDFRIPTVLRKIDPFLETMTDLMKRQSLTPPSVLSSSEVRELGRSLKKACQRLQELRIPDSLGHGDLNLANIIVGEHQSVFIDWAEAYVGHPFSTFEYLQLARANSFQEFEDDRAQLDGSYMQAWETVCSSGRIAEALSLTPILAVLLKGLNTADCLDANIHRNSRPARRLRSLTRRMQLETQKTTKLGATWAVS